MALQKSTSSKKDTKKVKDKKVKKEESKKALKQAKDQKKQKKENKEKKLSREQEKATKKKNKDLKAEKDKKEKKEKKEKTGGKKDKPQEQEPPKEKEPPKVQEQEPPKEKETAKVDDQEKALDPAKRKQDEKQPQPFDGKRKKVKSPPGGDEDSPRRELFTSPSPSNSGFQSPSPVLSLDNLQSWREEAAKRGVSLEDYMEEISRDALEANVESHMRSLAAEAASQDGAGEEEPAQEKTEKTEKPEAGNADKSEETDNSKKAEKPEKADNSEKAEKTEKPAKTEKSEKVAEKPEKEKTEEPAETEKVEEESEGEGEEEECAEDDEEVSDDSSSGGSGDIDGESVNDEEMAEKDQEAKVEKAVTVLMPEQKISEAVKTGEAHAIGIQKEDFSKANSTSHKTQWDTFNRQCLNRKVFPTSLAQHYCRDKLDLFRTWLQEDKDWSQVAVHFERKATHQVTNTKQRSGIKERDLEKVYGATKTGVLVKKLKAAGMYYYDPDFPADEEDRLRSFDSYNNFQVSGIHAHIELEEIYYYANVGNTIKDENITSESQSLQVKSHEKELVHAIAAEGAVLGAGAAACASQRWSSPPRSPAPAACPPGTTPPEPIGPRAA